MPKLTVPYGLLRQQNIPGSSTMIGIANVAQRGQEMAQRGAIAQQQAGIQQQSIQQRAAAAQQQANLQQQALRQRQLQAKQQMMLEQQRLQQLSLQRQAERDLEAKRLQAGINRSEKELMYKRDVLGLNQRSQEKQLERQRQAAEALSSGDMETYAALDPKGFKDFQKQSMERKKDKFSQEDKLRDEYQKLSSNFRIARDAYNDIRRIKPDPKNPGVSDMSLLFAYLKVLDPGSRVTEKEIDAAKKTRGASQTVINLWDEVYHGGTLTESQRKEFKRQAEELYKSKVDTHKTLKKEYGSLANKYGLDQDAILRGSEELNLEAPKNKKTRAIKRYNPETGRIE